MPRENIPGGYRPYYEQQQPADRRAAPPQSPPQSAAPARPGPAPSLGGGRGPSVGESLGEKGRVVESQDLAPIMGADGSRLPNELWRGMTVPEVEQMMGNLSVPPRSAALHDLWRRLLIAKSAEPGGGKTATHFLALRLAALYKSGLLKDLEAVTAAPQPANAPKEGEAPTGDLVLAVQRAKAQLGLGQREAACVSARSAQYQGEVPRPVAQDALLLIAYCAAAEGNAAAASLTVDLGARAEAWRPLWRSPSSTIWPRAMPPPR